MLVFCTAIMIEMFGDRDGFPYSKLFKLFKLLTEIVSGI